jgi:hypothetical protein
VPFGQGPGYPNVTWLGRPIDDTVQTFRQVVNFKGTWETHIAQSYSNYRGPYLAILGKFKILPGLQLRKKISWKPALAHGLRDNFPALPLSAALSSFSYWGAKALQTWPQCQHNRPASTSRLNMPRGWTAYTKPLSIPTVYSRRETSVGWFISHLRGICSSRND